MDNRACIVIINGLPRVGKDTLTQAIMSHPLFDGITSIFHSSIETVKRAALQLGWDGVKDERGRRFLADLKRMSIELYDGPFEEFKRLKALQEPALIITHIREDSEIQKWVTEFKNVVTVLVEPAWLSADDLAELKVDWNNCSDNINQDPEAYSYVFPNDFSGPESEWYRQKLEQLCCYIANQWSGFNVRDVPNTTFAAD